MIACADESAILTVEVDVRVWRDIGTLVRVCPVALCCVAVDADVASKRQFGCSGKCDGATYMPEATRVTFT